MIWGEALWMPNECLCKLLPTSHPLPFVREVISPVRRDKIWKRCLQDHGSKTSSDGTEANAIDCSSTGDLDRASGGWAWASGTNRDRGRCWWGWGWAVGAGRWHNCGRCWSRGDGIGGSAHNGESDGGWSADRDDRRTGVDHGRSWACFWLALL